MEQIIDLEQVKTAMQALRSQGERVSRRNVRRFLGGGGMSTIHRLMKDIEELEDLHTRAAHQTLSDALFKTILKEIASQVEQATAGSREQIKQLEIRESEAIEDLTVMEQQYAKLQAEQTALARQLDEQQNQSAKAMAVAEQTIHQLRLANSDLEEDCDQLLQTIKTEKIAGATTRLQLEAANQAAGKAENQAEKCAKEIQQLIRLNTDTEKKVAAATQKAADLREALVKAEKRIRALEQRFEAQK
jgi:chromosome segregation ATPase